MAHIADIIKYEGDGTAFVWKHPCEDFNSYSQLIVHETQEAVLFLNGQALDSFGPGRHTLETQNTPLLSSFLKRTTNSKTPFHCEVYFINKTEQMAIRWGTDSQAQFLEPTYHFPLSLGASGEMSLRVRDARRLLLRLVGTAPVLDQQTLAAYFRAFLMARVKTYIAQFMQANTVSIFELDAHMLDFSGALQQQLAPDFADYGVELVRFFVTNLARPDGDAQYEKFKELHFRKYADIAEAQLRQRSHSGANRSAENAHRFAGDCTEARTGGLHLPAGTQLRCGAGRSKKRGRGRTDRAWHWHRRNGRSRRQRRRSCRKDGQ